MAVRLLDTETNRSCLTTGQARRESDLSGIYLTQLLRKGTLEGFKIDREWFVYTDSLEAFLAKKRKPGPKGPRKPQVVAERIKHNENIVNPLNFWFMAVVDHITVVH